VKFLHKLSRSRNPPFVRVIIRVWSVYFPLRRQSDRGAPPGGREPRPSIFVSAYEYTARARHFRSFATRFAYDKNKIKPNYSFTPDVRRPIGVLWSHALPRRVSDVPVSDTRHSPWWHLHRCDRPKNGPRTRRVLRFDPKRVPRCNKFIISSAFSLSRGWTNHWCRPNSNETALRRTYANKIVRRDSRRENVSDAFWVDSRIKS